MRLLMNWALRETLAPELPARLKASALPRKNTPVMCCCLLRIFWAPAGSVHRARSS
jgi:hypothetical protein